MQFKDYQKKAWHTKLYPKISKGFVYPTLGLAGEAGEVAEKIKKLFRDKNGKAGKAEKEEIKKELGDVLWYITALSLELGFSLEDVAKTNLEKLYSRKKRSRLKGSGDNR